MIRRINHKRRPNCNTDTAKNEAKKAETIEKKVCKTENELCLDGDQGHKLDRLSEKSQKQRFFGMDVVRILALCLLYWLHFFLRNGFYSQPVDNLAMIVAVSGRIIFMCCVPLFLMITGYLKCGKTWTRDYYFSLVPILLSWAMISFICIGYKILVTGTQKTVYEWIVEFFDYSGANYGWYIEMYIGLLLMSPFVNLAWNTAGTQKMHRLIVAVMVVLTILPKTINVLTWDGENTLNIVPNYWVNLYFITYYLIGCYIRTYQAKGQPHRVPDRHRGGSFDLCPDQLYDWTWDKDQCWIYHQLQPRRNCSDYRTAVSDGLSTDM